MEWRAVPPRPCNISQAATMLLEIDWTNKSDVDKAFFAGYILSQYNAAIVSLNNALLTLTLSGGNVKLDDMSLLQGDTAVLIIANTDFSKFEKPDVYYEMASFSLDKSIIVEYGKLRKLRNHRSFSEESEAMIQKAFIVLGATA